MNEEIPLSFIIHSWLQIAFISNDQFQLEIILCYNLSHTVIF